MYVYLRSQGASTAQVIVANMNDDDDDNDGQMIFGELGAESFLTFVLEARKTPGKNPTQETCPNQGSNPGPLRDRRACYRLVDCRNKNERH